MHSLELDAKSDAFASCAEACLGLWAWKLGIGLGVGKQDMEVDEYE